MVAERSRCSAFSGGSHAVYVVTHECVINYYTRSRQAVTRNNNKNIVIIKHTVTPSLRVLKPVPAVLLLGAKSGSYGSGQNSLFFVSRENKHIKSIKNSNKCVDMMCTLL